MLIDSDEEMSELEMGSKTFQKLAEKMKKLGFQEGIAHGRSTSLQNGFDLGYSAGFQVGLQIGKAQAKARLDADCNPDFARETDHEHYLKKIPDVNCELCVSEENEQLDYDFINKTFEEMAFEEDKNKSNLYHLLIDANI